VTTLPSPGSENTNGLIVAVVDDHPLYRDALVSVLMSSDRIASVIVADSVEDYEHSARFVESAGSQEPHVVLLDLGLPGVCGTAAVRRVADGGPPVLVVSAEVQDDRVVESLAAGAAGFLSKTADGPDLLAATLAVASGQRWVSPRLAGRLLTVEADRPHLSRREQDVLSQVTTGNTDREIAANLHISVSTVRSHLDRIRDKTGHRRRADMVRFALEERDRTRRRE
jgi:DNA-binding NarL/FixJ family response regulator